MTGHYVAKEGALDLERAGGRGISDQHIHKMHKEQK